MNDADLGGVFGQVPDGHETTDALALTVSATATSNSQPLLARVRAFVHYAHTVGGAVTSRGVETAC
jgi:hypothetical protein